MSSNIKIQRICNSCGNEFTARTTVTQFCSDKCAKKAYKEKIRNSKIEKSNIETKRIKTQVVVDLKSKEFLTVTQVSKLIGCSRQNVYKLINSGKLIATNILEKKTIVLRSDLDKLFKEPLTIATTESKPDTQKQDLEEWKQAGNINITECYTLSEIQTKYNVSEKALQVIIIRNNIPKIKRGWYAYVPKTEIDKIFCNLSKS